MHLYNLTLQKANKITHAIHGNFSGTKQQEIVVSRGKVLEVLKPDPNTGKIYTLVSEELFGVVRCLISFRQTGSSKDYIIVGSDSGRIVILEFDGTKNAFKKVHQETFGKSGFRRTIPGQYLAVDPKGRALIICALEKQKLVHILNRDAQAHLTISSPLEAHRNNTILYDVVGVDVGFENPTFACLEFDYEECDLDPSGEAVGKSNQMLTYYELDLGLNHVVRKYSVTLDLKANMLISVPGGTDGPSGVLLCCENYLMYKNFGDQPDIRCPIPRRRNDLDDPERSMFFACTATHRTKSMFFFLAQTEQGDIFKITLETDDDLVTEIRLKYFDTVPVASSICVLKSGCLFVASDAGNHNLYQIAHLGDDDDEPEFTSSMPLEEGDTFFFAPRPLKNLVVIDDLNNLCPIIDCRIADLGNEDTPQLYTLCGTGPRSTLRVLKHGLEISEMAVSELPGSPNAVWTVKRRVDDEYDAYIVVSFVNATLVLSIGETVEEVTDSGFLGTTPTLSCSQLGNDALVQIYPEGIRHIRADKRVNEWKSPGKRSIVRCAVNQRQVVIALSGGELVYFEMDQSGQLNEYTERKEMSADVICMSLGRVPANEQRTRFLSVGLDDNTVRIISLDPSDCLSPLSMQALPATPESLCVVEMGGSVAVDTIEEGGGGGGRSTVGGLYLNIGLQNGVLLRTVVDTVTGDLSDTRTRYLGSKAVKLFKVSMQSCESVLAMSSRSWLSYVHQRRFHLTPLSYESLEYASGFASEQCPEGIVAISGNTLRILAVEKLGVVFNQSVTPLQYTPRRLEIHPPSQGLILIEADHNTYTEDTKDMRKKQMAKEMIEAAGEEEQQLACEMAHTFLEENLQEDVFGSAKAGAGMWASSIRIMKPATKRTLFKLPLEQNEAALCLSLLKFSNRPDDEFAVVGVAKDLVLSPRSHSGGSIHVYRLTSGGEKLELVHKTSLEDVPSAVAPFRGKVLVGVGRFLRLYDLGRKKLLRKCENKHIPNNVVSIKSMGDRIVVGDLQESLHFVKYKAAENRLVVFADDIIPRWITATCLLDYHTVAGGDKFGNLFVMRLPNDVNDEVDEDPTGNKSLWDRGLLSGAAQKLMNVSTFHVGETVTSLQKASLIPGGSEALVYTTLTGGVGMLVPFTSHEDHDFFQHLEMYMRSEVESLVGRDHMAFRSSYVPIKNVIDGDLCELFGSLEHARQVAVSQDLDRTPNEVSKKLEDIRTRFAF